jgi:hypothetical protein
MRGHVEPIRILFRTKTKASTSEASVRIAR